MTGPVVPAGSEKGWCLNCNEWGDPDPVRAHPASECPWRPVPPGGEELREALAEAEWKRDEQDGPWGEFVPMRSYYLSRADALLPTVLAFAEEQGRRRAAEELRAAAFSLDDLANSAGGDVWFREVLDFADDLRARAAALAPENARPE